MGASCGAHDCRAAQAGGDGFESRTGWTAYDWTDAYWLRDLYMNFYGDPETIVGHCYSPKYQGIIGDVSRILFTYLIADGS